MSQLTHRRGFLQECSLIALSPAIPGFLAQSARADAIKGDERILVVIQLDGGNDGINTIVPHRDEGYAKHRKVLRLRTDRLLKISDDVALHPAMRPTADLLEDGRFSIIQGVGYPNPNRSHEVSMRIWQSARPGASEKETFGWIGRTTDKLPGPKDGSPSSILLGTQSPPLTLKGRKSTSISMAHLRDLQRIGETNSERDPAPTVENDLQSFVERTTLDAYAAADLLKGVSRADASATYPAFPLAERLRMIAQLIKSGFKTPVYYTIHGGFDTHILQLPDHARLLGQLASSLKAFLDDLKSANLEDRVLVMCFSEFGRRVKENASQGTDHGTAAPMFLAGSALKSGLVGQTPSLTDLDDGDLRMNIDFRQVYSTLLSEWLKVSPTILFPEGSRPLEIL